MKSTPCIGLVSLVLTGPVFSADNEKTNEKLIEKSTFEDCKVRRDNCIKNMEVIEVRGQKPNPISFTSKGVYTLDRKLIEDYRFGNGNLNDVLGVLPGVQYGEAAYSAEQITNIKPSEVSLAGTTGKATGYLIDGVSNNSNLNNHDSSNDRNLLQDVVGHSQEVFLNLELVDSIEVYDSNIPAKYGDFSGGLVKAETRKARESLEFGLSYRQTADDWVEYHRFYAPDFDGSNELDTATFNKRNFSGYVSAPLTEKLGMVAQIQFLDSKESLDQLGSSRLQTQTNYNGLLKLDYALTPHDDISVSYLFAPYEGEYFDVNAINSDYTIKGGGNNASFKWDADRDWAYFTTKLAWRDSRNSKNAAPIWFNWLNIPGKNWGDVKGSINSSEGGFGDIEKKQQSLILTLDFELATNHFLGAYNSFTFGYSLEQQTSIFDRLEDAVTYNGAITSTNINCAGYISDCIETELFRPFSEIEAELGRPIDLTNIDDFVLYQNNFKTTGQYFQYRQVSPKARAEATVNSFGTYLENEFDWENYRLTLGARYDYNDFFKNHNFAPRIRGSIYLFDSQGMIVLGANRYYASDTISYKLNAAMQPTLTEVRALYQNRPQQWKEAVNRRGYKHVYDKLKTPLSDELSAAYRHQVLGGTLELKYLYREQKDSINRIKGTNDAGEAILFGANDGSSRYQRWTLAWMATYENQHVEFNVSHATNTTSRAQFDGDPRTFTSGNNYFLNFNYDDNELVFLSSEYYDIENRKNETDFFLVTRNDMEQEKQDFNRPIVANLSWGGRWENWSVSAYARYNGEQDALYATGQSQSVKEANTICDGCEPDRREFPVYRIDKRPAFWLLSGSVKYTMHVANDYRVSFTFEGENLLNKRTYQVSPYSTGLELGRRFWLGVNINY